MALPWFVHAGRERRRGVGRVSVSSRTVMDIFLAWSSARPPCVSVSLGLRSDELFAESCTVDVGDCSRAVGFARTSPPDHVPRADDSFLPWWVHIFQAIVCKVGTSCE